MVPLPGEYSECKIQLPTVATEAVARKMFRKKVFFKFFSKFIGKHLCQSLLFNKNAGLRPATLLKKRLRHRCFPVNFTKFLKTSFLQNSSGGCFCSKYENFEQIFLALLDKSAPYKSNKFRANQVSYMAKYLGKSVMKRTSVKNQVL